MTPALEQHAAEMLARNVTTVRRRYAMRASWRARKLRVRPRKPLVIRPAGASLCPALREYARLWIARASTAEVAGVA